MALVMLKHKDIEGDCVVPESTAVILEARGWKRSEAKRDQDPRPVPPVTTSATTTQ